MSKTVRVMLPKSGSVPVNIEENVSSLWSGLPRSSVLRQPWKAPLYIFGASAGFPVGAQVSAASGSSSRAHSGEEALRFEEDSFALKVCSRKTSYDGDRRSSALFDLDPLRGFL